MEGMQVLASWVLLFQGSDDLPTDHAVQKGNLAVRCKPDPS